MGDDLAAAADVGGDHRESAGRRLHGRPGEALTVRRQQRRGRRPGRRAPCRPSHRRRRCARGAGRRASSPGEMASALSGSDPPTTTNTTSGCVSRRLSAATKSSRKPFCQTRRPTVPTTTASPSTPRLARACRRRCVRSLRDGIAGGRRRCRAAPACGSARRGESALEGPRGSGLVRLPSTARPPVQGVHHSLPRRPVLRTGIETMHGVDHAREPRPHGQPPVRRRPVWGYGCGRCRA